MKNKIMVVLLVYSIFSTYLINAYDTKIDKLLVSIDNLYEGCINNSDNSDLEERY